MGVAVVVTVKNGRGIRGIISDEVERVRACSREFDGALRWPTELERAVAICNREIAATGEGSRPVDSVAVIRRREPIFGL